MKWLTLLFFFSQAQASMTAGDLAACAAAQTTKLQKENFFATESDYSTTKANFYPSVTLAKTFSASANPINENKVDRTTVSIQQKVLDFSSDAATTAAYSRFKAAQFRLDQSSLALSLSAVRDLTGLQNDTDKVKELDRQIENYDALIRVLSAGDRIGTSDSNNLLQAKSMRLSIQTQKKLAEFELSKASVNFKLLYGFSPPNFSTFESRSVASVNSENAPSVKAAAASVSAIQNEREQFDRAYWPSLSLRGDYTITDLNGSSLPTSPNRELSATIVLDLSGLWKDAERRTAFSSIRQVRENALTQEKQSIKNSLTFIEEEFANIEARLPLLKARLSLNDESRELTKAKIRLGKLSFVELQQTEDLAYQAAIEYSSTLIRQKELLVSRELFSIFSSGKLLSLSCSLK